MNIYHFSITIIAQKLLIQLEALRRKIVQLIGPGESRKKIKRRREALLHADGI